MKKLLIASIAIITLCIVGCGGGAEELDAPQILRVIMGATSITVDWEEDTAIESHADFSGYNIYVYTDSSDLLVEDGENLNRDNATTQTGNTYTITGLDQDTVYYIQVRTVNTDDIVGGYNSTTPFMTASPRPEFTATVNFEIGVGPDADCAVRFVDAALLSDEQMADSSADMWIDAWSAPNYDTVATASPSHNTQYGAGANVTMFANYGQYDFDSVSQVTTEPTDTTSVAIAAGDLVVAKTADDHYVKIHVDNVDRVNLQVTVTYGYQNIADFPYFSQ